MAVKHKTIRKGEKENKIRFWRYLPFKDVFSTAGEKKIEFRKGVWDLTSSFFKASIGRGPINKGI